MELYEFYPKIFEKKIPLNLLDITSRNYSNWKKENLLYNTKKLNKEDDEKRERVLLNVFDALWLSIVKELKKFNVDFNTIRQVKDVLYSNLEFDQEKIDTLTKNEFVNSILQKTPEEYHQVIKQLLVDGSLFKMIDSIVDEKNVILFKNIGNILFQILVQKVAISLIITKDDDFVEVIFFKNEMDFPNTSNIKTNERISDIMINTTYINIPLVPLVGKLFENTDFDKYNFHYNLFNKNERKIIEALNDNNCKEIKVTKHNSGDITLNISFEKEVKKAEAKEIRKILGLKQYEKMEVVFRNDSHLILNNTKKEVLKK
ncbi:hypothetical protein [Flavobacterium sp.]|uniref:hypothetical protein n=1 Tax=Flavobacterium sp. TaxID=239 RepID=UPI004047C98B